MSAAVKLAAAAPMIVAALVLVAASGRTAAEPVPVANNASVNAHVSRPATRRRRPLITPAFSGLFAISAPTP